MKLSTRGHYGIRALMERAKTYEQGPLSLKIISAKQGIPLKYPEQIALILREAALITSVRGTSGGYELPRDPSKTDLLEIVESLEGPLSFVRCVQDPASCDRINSCAANEIWKKVSQKSSKVLKSYTLTDMVKIDAQKEDNQVNCFDSES